MLDAPDPRPPAPSPAAPEPAPAAQESPESAADRLARLVDPTPAPALSLATGHTAAVHPSEPDRLVVRGPAGEVQLSIRFTPEGPVLSFSAAAIDLRSAGAVTVDCARFDVRAREGVEVCTGGDLTQSAAGTVTVDAQQVAVQAHNGEIALDATGDVDVHGARVLLNS